MVNSGSNGADVFPSLHFAVSFYLLIFDWWHARSRFLDLSRPVHCILWSSTVLLRFHYFVDLIGGLARRSHRPLDRRAASPEARNGRCLDARRAANPSSPHDSSPRSFRSACGLIRHQPPCRRRTGLAGVPRPHRPGPRHEHQTLPLQWSATQNVAWKQTIPGPRLVLTRARQRPAVSHFRRRRRQRSTPMSLRALCLDEASGRILWDVRRLRTGTRRRAAHPQQEQPRQPHPARRRRPRLRPLRPSRHRLPRASSGKVIWKNTELSYPPVHGNGGSPILVENKLVFSCDGGSDPFVVALDKTTGKVIWKTPRVTPAKKTFSFSTPLLITVNGRQQIISPGSGAVCAFDPETGKELWRARYGEGYSVIPRPVSSATA
jgi:hypothetical protein